MIKSIEPINHPAYLEAVDRGLIESGILPLTNALYSIGAFPLASCSGHFESMTLLKRIFLYETRPYVLFSCELSLAKKLSQKFDNGTFYCWRISGYFHPSTQDLVWTIDPIDHRLKNGQFKIEKLKSDIEIMSNNIKDLHN